MHFHKTLCVKTKQTQGKCPEKSGLVYKKAKIRRERLFIYQDDDRESDTSDADFVTSLSITIEYFKAYQ